MKTLELMERSAQEKRTAPWPGSLSANRSTGGFECSHRPFWPEVSGHANRVRLRLVDGSVDMPVALAEVCQDAKAEAILREDLKKYPEDTLWQYWRGPEIAAAIALARNQPLDAIEALRKSIPYDLRDTEVPAMRARAFQAASQFDLAEAEFQKIIHHQTAGVPSANVALAHLGIARARALRGNRAGSREEYEAFFAAWKDAEPDVPVLRQAKAEYAELSRNGFWQGAEKRD
jgi:predicted Zn-dependent protease